MGFRTPFVVYFITFSLFIPTLLLTQNTSLYRGKQIFLENEFIDTTKKIHLSIKPFLSVELPAPTHPDSFASKKRKISILEIIDLKMGTEKNLLSKQILNFAGGLSVEGKISNKLFFNTTYITGNGSFQSYTDTCNNSAMNISGMGKAYASKLGYSYQYYSGYVSYSPNNIFNFQIGKDKHFWGEGYRSLFLSDVSNSFPFLKISTTIWKIKYVTMFAALKDTKSEFNGSYKNKYGSFHYLSWNANKRINISFFEAIIWQGTDSNRARGFDLNYLNPVIFYRPVEYSLGSSDNSLMGISYKIKLGKNYRQQFYGQLILDEFIVKEVLSGFKKLAYPNDQTIQYGWWGNKQGVQFGFKSFNVFNIKNLLFQTELNAVRPYTYSHGSVQQNYSNFNQPLAHPLGANFGESVSFLNYKHKRWMFETEFLYARYGKDENGKNWGHNIFESYETHPNTYGNIFFQGLKTNLTYTKLNISYQLFPSANLLAEAGIALRQEKYGNTLSNSLFIFIGIKTSLLNRYTDY